MEIKPELQKTIKRLAGQKNLDVLKNKIRSWIATRELPVPDLIRYCREKVINVPPQVLNKLGTLFGSGKEGLNEDSDSAFLLYLAAADFGFAPANGNVAQYYFDGRAPGGKNLDLAFQYCTKAIEQGADKFMLMSEILHQREDYGETIKYLTKIIENRHSHDQKRKVEARKLEMECLCKQLAGLFAKLSPGATTAVGHYNNHSSSSPITTAPYPSSHVGPYGPSGLSSPAALGGPMSPMMHQQLQQQQQQRSLTRIASMDMKLLNVHYLPAPIPLRNLTSPSNAATAAVSHHRHSHHGSHHHSHGHGQHHHQAQLAAFSYHRLPGWFHISDDLEGFDYNACAELTARAEVISLEAEAIRSAYEAAEQHVNNARKYKFSEEVIHLLVKNKLHEFQDIYHSLEANKEKLLSTWHAYGDTAEHTLRRQILTEKKFFNPARMSNPLIFTLAKEMYQRRLYNYPAYYEIDWNAYTRPDEFLNQTLILLNLASNNASNNSNSGYRIASMRSLITAERSLLETAVITYGFSADYHARQHTGWTGKINGDVFDVIHHQQQQLLLSMKEEQPPNIMGNYHRPTAAAAASSNAHSTNTHGGHHGQHNQHGQQHGVQLKHQQEVSLLHHYKESLLHELTYPEAMIIGTAVIRYSHYTHPRLLDGPGSKAQGGNSGGIRGEEYYYHMEELGSSSEILKFLHRLAMIEQPSYGQPHHPHGHPHSHGHGQSSASIMAVGGNLTAAANGGQQFLDEITGGGQQHGGHGGHGHGGNNGLNNSENESKLAELMIRFTHDGKPITTIDLQKMNEEAQDEDGNRLMRIVYHYFVKRLIPWILPCQTAAAAATTGPAGSSTGAAAGGAGTATEEQKQQGQQQQQQQHRGLGLHGEHYQPTATIATSSGSSSSSNSMTSRELPLATAQARALMLVRAGLLTFSEIFELTSPYGIFHFLDKDMEVLMGANNSTNAAAGSAASGPPRQHTFALLRTQIIAINALYQRSILENTGQNFIPLMQFLKKHEKGVTIPTYKVLRHELQEVYGGEADSDNEGGDDDDDNLSGVDASPEDIYGSEDKELDILLGKLRI